MARSGSRPGLRGVVATWLLILAACVGTLLACGNDDSAPPGASRPSAPSTAADRDPSPNDSTPQSGIQAIVGTWCDPQGQACLVIAPDGSVDDSHGQPWLKDGDTATITPLSGSRFALASSASPHHNELELSQDGTQLTSVHDGENYIKHG